MSALRFILPILLSLFPLVSAPAQTRVLSYSDALKLGLKQNTNLKKEYNLYEVSRAYKFNAVSNLIPQLSISSTGLPEISNGKQFDVISGQLIDQRIKRMNLTGSATMTLFNGFEKYNSLEQAEKYLNAQKENIEQTKLDMFYSITKLYLQLLLNQEMRKIQKINFEVQKKQLEYIEIQVELGTRSLIDLYTQKAELKKAELNLLEVETQFKSDEAELSNIIQSELQDSVVFEKPVFIKRITGTYNPDSLYFVALSNRPDLKKQIELYEAYRRSFKIARSKLYPNITGYFSIGSGYTALIDEDFKTQFYDINKFYLRGISINIPLTNAFHYRHSIVAARIQQQNSNMDIQQTKIIIYNQVQTSLQRLANSQKALEVSLAGYDAAANAHETAKERYQLGLVSFLELAFSNRTYIQSIADKTRAEYNFLFQELMLAYYCATLNVNTIE